MLCLRATTTLVQKGFEFILINTSIPPIPPNPLEMIPVESYANAKRATAAINQIKFWTFYAPISSPDGDLDQFVGKPCAKKRGPGGGAAKISRTNGKQNSRF